MIGSAFTTSRYSSKVPRHCFDSRAARSSLITRSKLLRSAIGYLLRVRVIECWAVLLPGRGGICRAVLFLEPILVSSISEPRNCNKLHRRKAAHSGVFRINRSAGCKFALHSETTVGRRKLFKETRGNRDGVAEHDAPTIDSHHRGKTGVVVRERQPPSILRGEPEIVRLLFHRAQRVEIVGLVPWTADMRSRRHDIREMHEA